MSVISLWKIRDCYETLCAEAVMVREVKGENSDAYRSICTAILHTDELHYRLCGAYVTGHARPTCSGLSDYVPMAQ